MSAGHVCALVSEGCFLCCNWPLRCIVRSQRDEIGPGGGSVHLQGVTSFSITPSVSSESCVDGDH